MWRVRGYARTSPRRPSCSSAPRCAACTKPAPTLTRTYHRGERRVCVHYLADMPHREDGGGGDAFITSPTYHRGKEGMKSLPRGHTTGKGMWSLPR